MEKDKRELSNQFANELEEWSKTGKKPKSGNQDITYFLELQRDRLKERNIQMEYDLSLPKKKEDQISGGRATSSSRQSGKYVGRIDFCTCQKKMVFYKEGKKVFSRKRTENLYVTTTDLKYQHMVGADTYCCPNCGAISTIQELQEGCSFCQTKFRMTDLFPKVTDFCYLCNDVPTSYVKLIVRVCMILGCLAMVLFSLWEGVDENAALAILELAFGGLLGCGMGYLASAIMLLFFMIGKAVSSIPSLRKHGKARKKIVEIMSSLDKSFSYDYFMNQVMSKLKIVLFAKDRNNLAVYEGAERHTEFDNIIEMTSLGVMDLQWHKTENGYCTICLDVPMMVVHDLGNKVCEKKDTFRITICKNISKPEDVGFSMKKVSCPGCGASFDATREKNCPYCQTVYDIKEDSWVVTELKYV